MKIVIYRQRKRLISFINHRSILSFSLSLQKRTQEHNINQLNKQYNITSEFHSSFFASSSFHFTHFCLSPTQFPYSTTFSSHLQFPNSQTKTVIASKLQKLGSVSQTLHTKLLLCQVKPIFITKTKKENLPFVLQALMHTKKPKIPEFSPVKMLPNWNWLFIIIISNITNYTSLSLFLFNKPISINTLRPKTSQIHSNATLHYFLREERNLSCRTSCLLVHI